MVDSRLALMVLPTAIFDLTKRALACLARPCTVCNRRLRPMVVSTPKSLPRTWGGNNHTSIFQALRDAAGQALRRRQHKALGGKKAPPSLQTPLEICTGLDHCTVHRRPAANHALVEVIDPADEPDRHVVGMRTFQNIV